MTGKPWRCRLGMHAVVEDPLGRATSGEGVSSLERASQPRVVFRRGPPVPL